jgi:hypothetical protein
MSRAQRRRQVGQDDPWAWSRSAAAVDGIAVTSDDMPVLVEYFELGREARYETERKDNFESKAFSAVFKPGDARILWAPSKHGVEAYAEAAAASRCAIRR